MRRAILGIPLVIAILATLVACDGSDRSTDDPVLSVSAEDDEMVLAIAKARESLPRFWQVFESPRLGETDFCLKVRIEDSHGAEHFWVTDLRREEGRVFGLIGNDANTVDCVELGDEIEVRADAITDWLYMRDGKMVGNFTVRPLFDQMPEEEVQRWKSMLLEE